MYTKSAAIYDAIYSFKNYAAEVSRLRELIAANLRSDGRRLLDVACGTGNHLLHLQRYFEVEGVDASEQQLAIARTKCPAIRFHRGDMLDFDLGSAFDVVTCLFSSVGYVRTPPRLIQAISNLACHVRAGGVLIVEPWLLPGTFIPGHLGSRFVEQENLKIARMEIHRVVDRVSIFDEQFMVGTPDGIEFITERHELGLFTRTEYLDAFANAGLSAIWDERGLIGRGLVIGVKPRESINGQRVGH